MASRKRPREITAYYGNLIETDGSFQLEHYLIDLAMDQDAQELSVCVQCHVRAVRPVSRIRLNLSRTFHVAEIIGSRPVSRWYRRMNTVTSVLGEALPPGEELVLKLRYKGPIRVNSSNDQVLCAIEKTGGVLTDWWFPWVRGSRASFAVTLKVPSGLRAVANAPLLSQRVVKQWRRYEWRSDLLLNRFEIAIGDYAIRTGRSHPGLVAKCYYYEKDAAYVRNLMKISLRLLDLLYDTFGPGPWREIQLVEIPSFYNGGRGPAPMMWLSEQYFARIMDQDMAEGIAHELAHNWWGNLIEGVGPTGLWLQEGFATYAELLCRESLEGHEAYHRAAEEWIALFRQRTQGKDVPPLAGMQVDDPLFDLCFYIKGALILYELRECIGDGVFLNLLRDFCQNSAHQRVTVKDFRRSAEEASGVNLKPFFRRAFHESGLLGEHRQGDIHSEAVTQTCSPL